MKSFKKFPFYLQLDAMDCGATCLKMITKYYGKSISIDKLRKNTFVNREGVSLLAISDAAEGLGLHTLAARLSFEHAATEAPMPFIAYWKERHFLIVYEVDLKKNIVYVADPAHGLSQYTVEEFKKGWILPNGTDPEGLALFLEPTPSFYEEEEENSTEKRIKNLSFYFQYLKPYKKYYLSLFLSLLVSTIIQVLFPFLTQSLVDVGVNNQDLDFVYIVLIAQVTLFLSSKAGEFIRAWLSLHMINKVNVTIISDFLVKLMRLPISYFEKKTPGDILKRIEDHERIQLFLTTSSVDFIFTITSILIFGTILGFYNLIIFAIYAVGTVLYFAWILYFIKKRKEIDYRNFELSIMNQNKTLQIVNGIQEIKLQNCETQKRWEWERVQAKFFKLNSKSVALGQTESIGASVINELKNILLTFFTANLVIHGSMTLGMMIAVQYIVGQLNWITSNVIPFMHATQNALLSIDRLSEIHNTDNEELKGNIEELVEDGQKNIRIENLSFQYGSPRSPMVLQNINLEIPNNKVTAIVGASGSGKTTILKLLLRSYEPTEGTIYYGEQNLKNIGFKYWRKKFACVMQESYIFSDTIANNIAVGEEVIDKEKLKHATITANIREFIESLPVEYNTKIGQDGVGLSQGQRQRLFLARAVYKNSEVLLLDEATNALDTNNEKVIVENLREYYKGKTVVVVAHRLSTVKEADQIVVLNKGEIVEVGNHDSLVAQKGYYYSLIKNQLELGN